MYWFCVHAAEFVLILHGQIWTQASVDLDSCFWICTSFALTDLTHTLDYEQTYTLKSHPPTLPDNRAYAQGEGIWITENV